MRWSLKWQIQFWHGVILIILVTVLGVLFYQHEREMLLRETDWMMGQSLHPLANYVSRDRRPGPGRRPRGENRRGPGTEQPEAPDGWEIAGFQPKREDRKDTSVATPLESFELTLKPRGYYYLIWDSAGDELLLKSDNAPDMGCPPVRRPGSWVKEIPGERREMYQRISPRGCVLVGRYTKELEADLTALRKKLYLGGGLTIILSFGIGTLLVFRSTAPIKRIRQASRRVAEGNLSERVENSKRGSREMVELSDDLNTTFASLEKLFKRQSTFTADASHELRTPLTALIAQVKRGQGGGRSEEDYQAIFEICDRSMVRLKRIVDDLLELSRYDSGQVKLEREELALGLLVSTIADDYRPFIESQGSQINCDIASCHAYCDPFRIEQVLSNLIGNAVNHNDEPVVILLRVRTEGDWVVIEVEDNGVGITPKNLDHLFDRFYQEKKESRNSKSSSKEKSSGLGLAISKAIVEAHEGTIEVRSKPNVATVFVVRLPAKGES